MPPFDHFKLLAPIYEIFIKPKQPEELMARMDLPAEGALLDAGGGTGRVAQFLDGHAMGVVVADQSCRMLAEARGKPGLRPVCGETENLPFPDGFFARIIMVDAMHHVAGQQETIDELWRVLRPGGRMVIEEPDLRSLTVRLVALAEKLALMRSHFLRPEEISALFAYPDARVNIERVDAIAYITAMKES